MVSRFSFSVLFINKDMNNLILEEKTGFMTSTPFKILDEKGNIFYDSTFTDHIEKGETLSFNLPLGVYKYDGNFIKLSSPVKQIEISLPPKERHIKNGKRYKIIFGDNPNKCTIFYAPGVILFDNSFRDAPLYWKYGIYFHELGHHYYKTEWKADAYAAKKMLEYGFNPSQVGRVGLMTLSQNSYARQANMVKILTKKTNR